MTLEQLRALHAIVQEGSFRAAAARLNKAQSAVSHMISKLEDEIQVTLLSREAYRPTLTREGEVYYRQALKVLQQAQELNDLAGGLTAGQEAEVTLAVTATCPLGPVLETISDVRSAWPATHIRLSRESMGGTLEKLMTGQADLMIATLDGVRVEVVEVAPYTSVTILPVANPDLIHDHAGRLLSRAEMQGYTQVAVADSGQGAFAQSRDLMPGGQRWTVSDFAAKKEIIESGQGWGGMPDHMVSEDLASGALVALNVEDFPPRHSSIFKIRRRDQAHGQVARAIWEGLLPAA